MSDYLLKVSVRNNRILRKIRERGHGSLSSFAAAFGISYQPLAALVRMSESALLKNGGYRSLVLQCCDALQCNPEDLFNDRQLIADFGITTVETEIDEPLLLSMTEAPLISDMTPERAVSDKEEIAKAFGALNDRERRIVMARFGFDGSARTGYEIAEDEGVSHSVVYRIEQTAMRKMRWRLKA